jgi:hypothetical protein
MRRGQEVELNTGRAKNGAPRGWGEGRVRKRSCGFGQGLSQSGLGQAIQLGLEAGSHAGHDPGIIHQLALHGLGNFRLAPVEIL